ncbi:protein MULTIPLE CHLOROPLAST DIVISION SITE 1 [Cannabis sativa]|uniref:protein MULTIPLE CHLOROPLAST DIVISION SITE 1 n=1 Tax=Cannabis sativa TaxID=3483 RepID=UPI0029C9C8F9|nr:protein MULTIPLE CHLOROPLAST DIVISION SITE 1 [Cannabis sativa]
MASLSTLQWFQPSISGSNFYLVVFRPEFRSSNARITCNSSPSFSPKFVLRAIDGSATSASAPRDEVVKKNKIFTNTIAKFPILMRQQQQVVGESNFAIIGFCVATTFLVLAVKIFMVMKSRRENHHHAGSVADLVRRGQLRSDRRGITRPLKYDDPFNNPMVKVGKSNSTVEMCGKVYRLAPVTLTEEQQSVHQRRRSRAYQWKRPTIFLKEGDSIPPDVDPDTVRWIPSNHPFATTASDIDEDRAQNNVRQKRGVPFRIQAEHEALQRKLEALQGEQKLNKLTIDPSNAKDFERAFKSHPKSSEGGEESSLNEHTGNSQERSSNSSPSSEEMQKP